VKKDPQLFTVNSIQKQEVNMATKSSQLHFPLVILFLAVHCSVCSGICHISACDALQEMKNEIAKYNSASGEANIGKSCEIRLSQLERRLRAAEQTGTYSFLQKFAYTETTLK
jgi:hypothetical protein